jgi:osmotically-inducible protein OsmY
VKRKRCTSANEETIEDEALDEVYRDGALALRGTVVTIVEHDRAEQLARRVRGVRTVWTEVAISDLSNERRAER